MSTRSRIAVMHGEVCKSIYCHFDGYLEGVGRTLLQHYPSDKANNLVALGDMSVLAKNLTAPEGVEHSFEDRAEDTCVFYGRDRGEEDTAWQVAHSFEEFLEQVNACGGEYYYVMENGQWYCGSMDGKFERRLVLLSDALSTETVEA